jgi:hypothetical protein
MIVISVFFSLVRGVVFITSHDDPVAAQIRRQASEFWSQYGFVLLLVVVFGWVGYIAAKRIISRKS